MEIPSVLSILPQVVRLHVSRDQVADPRAAREVAEGEPIPQVISMPGVARITVPDDIAAAMQHARARQQGNR